MPFAADQFFWAERLRRLGIAADALSQRHVSAVRLRERLAIASGAGLRARAAEVAASVARETGVANAVACIEGAVQPRAVAVALGGNSCSASFTQ
jgi:sterol 3beta-glucosyltransferase